MMMKRQHNTGRTVNMHFTGSVSAAEEGRSGRNESRKLYFNNTIYVYVYFAHLNNGKMVVVGVVRG